LGEEIVGEQGAGRTDGEVALVGQGVDDVEVATISDFEFAGGVV